VNSAPPEVKQALQGMINDQARQKDVLIKEIMAYPQNQFSENDLRKAPIDNVRAIHAMIPRTQANQFEQPVPLFGDGAQGAQGVQGVTNYMLAAGGMPMMPLNEKPPDQKLGLPNLEFPSPFKSGNK